MHYYRHGRANRAVAGESVGDWATRRLLVVRLQLETARPAAQSADPGQGRPGESFAARLECRGRSCKAGPLMQADEPDTGMRHDDTLPSVETTMRFLALCERYGSEESAVAAVARGRRAGGPRLPYRNHWPAWNAAEMRAAVDYLEQAPAAATESGPLGR